MPLCPTPRHQAVIECLSFDLAEMADNMRKSAEAIRNITPLLQCVSYDMMEGGNEFDELGTTQEPQ